MEQEFATPVCLSFGNKKIGSVWAFSLPSFVTCPGASDWCREHCYARRLEKFRPNCRRAYNRNLALSLEPDLLVEEVLASLPQGAKVMRIHVGGDFFSPEYVEAWREICLAQPKTQFWSYTRSWNVPSLLPHLERLRALDNVELFASVDKDMPLPPDGWRRAFIEGDDRASGLACPHQQGRLSSCLECGYCFRKDAGDVVFAIH